MTTTELSVMERGGPIASAAEIRAQVNLIQEVMQAVMKDGVHFGTIPGTNKPTLFKAGAEKILSTFRIAIEPVVEDLSTPDEARFRVQARATAQASGIFLGSGVGECSSSEEKYRWRAAVCEQEFDETPEDRRRSPWKKSGTGPYQVKQVRTHHADIANTVLKMAKKRAQIDACLTVTAASDVFAQDIEDLPEELRGAADEGGKPPIQAPQRRSEAAPAATPAAAPAASEQRQAPAAAPPPATGDVISEKQAKRFFAIAMGAGWTEPEMKAWLKTKIGTEDDRQIPRRLYDSLCAQVSAGAPE